MNGEEKLIVLRKIMKERGYDAYIIPHGDQHDNEYIAEADERIKFISGFSGSFGLGLVTQNEALMWTDGRFYIQIENELFSEWELRKIDDDNENNFIDYIINHLPKNSVIGMDFHLFISDKAFEIINQLNDYTIVDDKNNIIDVLWGTLKPKYKNNKVIIFPEKYSGLSVQEKYKILDKKLKKEIKIYKKCDSFNKFRLLINRLDDIAWLLNLRGKDIPYNPVFFSFALFYSTPGELYVHLFVEKTKFNGEELSNYCKENKIYLFNYEDIYKELNSPKEEFITLLDVESTNCRILSQTVDNGNNEVELIGKILIEEIKSVKNPVEIQGFRNANIRDCVSLIKFFSWMEEELVIKNRNDLDEYQIGIKNKKFREEQELYMGESYAPICASGANSAIIHYEQNENLHSFMTKDKILLCDTGGHYMDGTTDITRTVHFGKPTSRQKEIYTRALLGNLFLERTTFEKGKSIEDIDSVARSFLFMEGLDFQHDTSHGVGHFLNVHEGPYGNPLQAGNILTNEPGYYERDNFGVRVENELLVVEKDNNRLGFENLTFLPYERNLIDMNLINEDFKLYINNFHKKVYDIISPFLSKEEKALEYLKKKTEPL